MENTDAQQWRLGCFLFELRDLLLKAKQLLVSRDGGNPEATQCLLRAVLLLEHEPQKDGSFPGDRRGFQWFFHQK